MLDATPLLRLWACRRLAALDRQDPVRTQERQLASLLRRAGATTRFGRAHGLAAVRSVAEYQARVKLRRYESFWSDWWQPVFPTLRHRTWPGRIPYFALSSGTTGATTKRIPVSRAMVRSNQGAALDLLAFHLRARPDSRVFGGANFLLGGSTALERLAPGVRAGDLSGIAAAETPFWARARAFPPRNLALIADWDAKIAALAPRSLAVDVRSFSGTPSWMLVFLERLAGHEPNRPRRFASFYPRLELLVHGGVGFAPYASGFARWLEGGHAETREAYAASEGFIAVADRGPGQGLRLVLDRGLFFEFVPVNQLDDPAPDRRWIADAEIDREYALVLSTNAGLWSYVLGDTVVLTSRDPARVLVTGRTAYTLSAFGEHLTAREIDAAVEAAAGDQHAPVPEYAVGALFPTEQEARGGHLFLVEFDAREGAVGAVDADRFARALDATLGRMNDDYAAHRAGGTGMLPPRVRILPRGTFEAWMRARGRLGGQNKVPRVVSDPDLFAALRAFVGDA